MKKTKLKLLTILVIALCSCNQNKPEAINDYDTPPETTTNPDSLVGKEAYVNPVDGNTYVTDGEWKEYAPDEEIIDTGIVKLKQIILVTEQSKIPVLIGVERLAEFIQKTDTIVKDAIGETDKEGELLVQITITSSGPKVKVSARDEVDGDKVSTIFLK